MKALIWIFIMCCFFYSISDGKDNMGTDVIRVLITTGGHDFETVQFFALFDRLDGISYDHVVLPDSADLLKPGLDKKYDVLVMYDMVDSISNSQQELFVGLLEQGIGLVALHHNLGAHRNWTEYTRIIGGKYLFKPAQFEGEHYPASDYKHDLDISVKVVNKDHPVTAGIKDFTIHDEAYKNIFVSSKCEILLTTDCPEGSPQIAWSHQYRNSPVFYLQLGHDSKAWANPNFPKIIQAAILWAAQR